MARRPIDRSAGWAGGWWWHAQRLPSPNQGERPGGTVIDLVIVHSISLPPGEYGGSAIEELFLNRLDVGAHPYYARLLGLRVSSHFVVRRSGEVLQFVSCDRRAWHAGASTWRGRSGCNDWSVGIELEGLEGMAFERTQYAALARILRALRRRYPLREVVGHEHVAPGRKFDPGASFDWSALRRRLGRLGLWLIGDPAPNGSPGARQAARARTSGRTRHR